MMRWRAGVLGRRAAARGDENIDYMVTRGRLECRERRMARAGLDGDGGQPAAGLLSGMQRTVQIATAAAGERSGIYPLRERRSLFWPASGAGGVETSSVTGASSPSASRLLRRPSPAGPPDWRESSGCLAIARADGPRSG